MNLIVIAFAYNQQKIGKSWLDRQLNTFRGHGKKKVTHWQFSLPAWRYVSEKWDSKPEILVLRDAKWDKVRLGPKWQRWLMLRDHVKNNPQIQKILMVDLDTIIRWDCPDLFDLDVPNGIAAIRAFGEDDEQRKNVDVEHIAEDNIQHWQSLFPDTDLDREKYFNNGIVMFDKSAFSIFEKINDFYWKNEEKLLETVKDSWSKDQTALNFLIQKHHGLPDLWPDKYNYQQATISKKNYIENSYIWHYNGDLVQKEHAMAKTWKKIKHHYKE